MTTHISPKRAGYTASVSRPGGALDAVLRVECHGDPGGINIDSDGTQTLLRGKGPALNLSLVDSEALAIRDALLAAYPLSDEPLAERVRELEAKLTAYRGELDIARRERLEEVSFRQEETRRADRAERHIEEASIAVGQAKAELEEARLQAAADQHRAASAEALAEARREHIEDLRAALDRAAYPLAVVEVPAADEETIDVRPARRLTPGDPDPGHGVTLQSGVVQWQKVEGRDTWAPIGQTQPAYDWDTLVQGFPPNGLEVIS